MHGAVVWLQTLRFHRLSCVLHHRVFFCALWCVVWLLCCGVVSLSQFIRNTHIFDVRIAVIIGLALGVYILRCISYLPLCFF